MKFLLLLIICLACNYQAPIGIQPGTPSIISGISVSDEVLDTVVLDEDKNESDYFDSYLLDLVVTVTDPVSGTIDTRVDYRLLNDKYSGDIEFQATRLKLYKFFRDIDLDSMPLSAKHALLINAYNFFTLETVLLNYEGGSLKSITDIGGEGSFRAFKEIFYRLGQKSVSLDQIENEILRPSLNFSDGRVHFALICASNGCPVLLPNAYRAETLEDQLNEATRIGLALPRILDLRNNQLKLSQIFDWFQDDFINQSGSIEAFLKSFRGDIPEQLPDVEYVDYDWGLNALR